MNNNVENTKLTDEQVDMILEKINEVTKDQEIPTREYTKEECTGFYKEEKVMVNPTTGEHTLLEENKEDDNLITEDLTDIEPENIELDDETIIKNLKDMSIQAEDMGTIISLVKEYKEKDGNITNAYNRLPNSIKSQINLTISESNNIPSANIKSIKNSLAKSMIADIVSDAEFDQISVDLDKSISSMTKELTEEVNKYYVDYMYEKIDALRKLSDEQLEKDREKSDTLNAIADALEESYKLDIFKEELPKIKVKKFEAEKPEKVYDTFGYKYNNSKFTIKSPETIIPIIMKHCECSKEEAVDLVLSFCKYCRNYNPNTNIAQHSFMYYFITNILSLNIIAPDREYNDFSKTLVDNLTECIEIRRKRNK